MLAALASMVVAVSAGAALALAGAGPRTLAPLRAFALAAVVATVVVHLLPEAIAAGGGAVLVAFAVALAVPGIFARIANLAASRGRPVRGQRLAAELAYASLLLHKVTDGIAVGAALAPGQPAHWDVIIAVAGHTLPMAAVVAVAYRDRPRQAWLRALGLAVAIAAGAGLADAAARTAFAELAPWLTAVAAGLLLHVVTHDLPSGAVRAIGDRVVEFIAIAAGALLPVAAGWFDADAVPAELPERILEVARAVAPALLLGLLATAFLQTAIGDRVVARARGTISGAIRGAIYGAAAPGCACAALTTAASVRRRGGG
ncbi:MAG: ZIP family metal transporter, partial [Deltaproteobacteria bacterium]|nr:ZIP family metal transporter [Deltaproteobacteria bacterium]